MLLSALDCANPVVVLARPLISTTNVIVLVTAGLAVRPHNDGDW
jgi:hypothetical protein